MQKSKGSSNFGDFYEAIGGTLSLSGYALGTMCINETSEDVLKSPGVTGTTSETGDFSSAYPGGITVLGIISTITNNSEDGYCSEGDPDTVIWLRDNRTYDRVEQRAQQVYDEYNHNHDKANVDGVTLISTDKDITKLVKKIMTSRTKSELVIAINGLQNVIEEKNRGKVSKDEMSLTRKKHEKK